MQLSENVRQKTMLASRDDNCAVSDPDPPPGVTAPLDDDSPLGPADGPGDSMASDVELPRK